MKIKDSILLRLLILYAIILLLLGSLYGCKSPTVEVDIIDIDSSNKFVNIQYIQNSEFWILTRKRKNDDSKDVYDFYYKTPGEYDFRYGILKKITIIEH